MTELSTGMNSKGHVAGVRKKFFLTPKGFSVNNFPDQILNVKKK